MFETPDFDAWYQGGADPFGARTRWYERRKRSVVLASLRRERYRAAWDPACGGGELLPALAARCDAVLGTDLSSSAVGIARELTSGLPHVEVEELELPDPLPRQRTFDLVVLSEILFYLPERARAETVALVDSVVPRTAGGELISVHWRHHPEDAHLSGAQVTDELDELVRGRGWDRRVRHEDEDFVLASWTRGALEPDHDVSD